MYATCNSYLSLPSSTFWNKIMIKAIIPSIAYALKISSLVDADQSFPPDTYVASAYELERDQQRLLDANQSESSRSSALLDPFAMFKHLFGQFDN